MNEILKFVKEFDFQHLDFLQLNSITVDVKEISDANIYTLVEHFQNQAKPLTTIRKLNDCKGYNLNIISNESEMIIKNETCSNITENFIRNHCQSYLIYTLNKLSLDDFNSLYKRLKCSFVNQPFVFFFKKQDSMNYELYELQVGAKRTVHLASWKTSGSIR